MEIVTKKIFSLCEDFNPEESGEVEEMYDTLSSETGCDVYIDYTAMTLETQEGHGYSRDDIAIRLVTLGAEDGEEVLIHIDY